MWSLYSTRCPLPKFNSIRDIISCFRPSSSCFRALIHIPDSQKGPLQKLSKQRCHNNFIPCSSSVISIQSIIQGKMFSYLPFLFLLIVASFIDAANLTCPNPPSTTPLALANIVSAAGQIPGKNASFNWICSIWIAIFRSNRLRIHPSSPIRMRSTGIASRRE